MTRKRKHQLSIGVLSVSLVAGGTLWQGFSSAKEMPPRAANQDTRVQTLRADDRPDPGARGSTFYWLESQTVRVTSRYADGAVTIGERGSDGMLHARLLDASGNERARLDVNDTVHFAPVGDTPFHARLAAHVRPTVQWANRQLYQLWIDGTRNLEWKNGLMRASATVTLPFSVDTEWAQGLSVKTERRPNATVRKVGDPNRVFTGESLSAQLLKDGLAVGRGEWFAGPQVFQWAIPSLNTQGYIDSERQKRYGGWTFTPDAEWLNLQLIAFHHFKSLIDRKGTVAANSGGCGRAPSLAERVLNAFAPTLLADEGCDGLHWLDGTVYRFCCDMHDACYEKYGCSASSWWRWGSWSCNRCNATAVWCFATNGCTSTLDCPYEQTS